METGWLIENTIPGNPGCTWAAFVTPVDPNGPVLHWTNDSAQAIRFALQRDAQLFIDHGGAQGCKVTEHTWG